MNSINRYFRDIYLGVTTVTIGMWVTLRHLFQRSVTVQYPHEKLSYPPRARTLLAVDIDSCNGCQQCSRACPVEIIHIDTVKAQEEDNPPPMPDGKPRKLLVVNFDVEMLKCVHCGLCVETCPTGSIHWENIHEEVSYTREGLMRHWSKYSAEERTFLLDREEKIKAEKAAKAAAAAAAKEAAEAKKAADEPPKAEAAAPAAAEDPKPAADAPAESPDKPTDAPESSDAGDEKKEGEA